MQKEGRKLKPEQLVELDAMIKDRRSRIHFSVFTSERDDDDDLDAKVKKANEDIRDFMNMKIKEEFDNKPKEVPKVK